MSLNASQPRSGARPGLPVASRDGSPGTHRRHVPGPYQVGPWHVGRWLPWATAMLVGVILGLVVFVVSPVTALAAVGGLVILVLAFTHPELVIVLVLALASNLLPSQLNPFVSLPIGSLQASDVLMLLLLGVMVMRALVEPRFKLRRTPLNLPLLLLVGSVFMGLGVAVIGFGVDLPNATYELRMLTYYLLFFPVINLVRTRAQLVRLIGGLVVVAVLIAVLMVATSALQSVPGYTESWALQEEGVARVFHPGYTVSFVGMMALLAYSALRPERYRGAGESGRALRWLLIGVLALGVLSTLARNLIVSGAISITLMYVLLARPERKRLVELLVFIAVLSVMLGVGLVVAGKADALLSYADLYLERLTRMFSPDIVGAGENLVPRWVEIEHAWAQLQRHPILGIGLYNPYRPAFYPGEPPQIRHFLHNAYLAIWIKMGLPGLLAFVWLSASYLRRGLRGWRQAFTGSHSALFRAAMLGGVVAFVGMLLSNMVAPSFVQPGSLAVFGVVLGLNEAILAVATRSQIEPGAELADGQSRLGGGMVP